LLGEEGSDPPEIVAPEEGQEPNLSEIDLSCQENFDEGKSILPFSFSPFSFPIFIYKCIY
jgi:hypothetical protein